MDNRETGNRLCYFICCVSKFAERHGIAKKDAFRYLDKYGGMSFLYECYEAEHTLSIEDSVDDITRICKRNGGDIYD